MCICTREVTRVDPLLIEMKLMMILPPLPLQLPQPLPLPLPPLPLLPPLDLQAGLDVLHAVPRELLCDDSHLCDLDNNSAGHIPIRLHPLSGKGGHNVYPQ